jgi:ABC-2 type transport system permease protein
VRPSEALVGKLAPYLVIGPMQRMMLLAIICVLFGVPPPASLALIAATPLFIGAYLMLGFAISAVAHTQIQSVQVAVFCYPPSLMLSGFMFPFNGMPKWAQAVGDALPLTHYTRARRNVLLRGAGASALWPDLRPIAAFAMAAALVAVACYRRWLN